MKKIYVREIIRKTPQGIMTTVITYESKPKRFTYVIILDK